MTRQANAAVEDHSRMVGQQPHAQYAALCFRRATDGHQILLITSRGTGRWVLPKGWAIKNLTGSGTAAQEALEEAGVRGKVRSDPIGSYDYNKWLHDGLTVPCLVQVYPLEVAQLIDDYPEKHERQRRWFKPDEAGCRVEERQLKKLLNAFRPEAPPVAGVK
ncbi:MAG: NUDIX hydrolase [Pseudomonadota bacterium]